MKHPFLCCLCWLLAAAPLAAQGSVDYTRDIKPLLTKHCAACHGPDKQRAGLRLDRSEEHTSELQSQSNLVCRLLLEKKTIVNGGANLGRPLFDIHVVRAVLSFKLR